MKKSNLFILALLAFACGEAPDGATSDATDGVLDEATDDAAEEVADEATRGATEEGGENEWYWQNSETGETYPATAAEIAAVDQEEAAAAQDASDVPYGEYGTLQQ